MSWASRGADNCARASEASTAEALVANSILESAGLLPSTASAGAIDFLHDEERASAIFCITRSLQAASVEDTAAIGEPTFLTLASVSDVDPDLALKVGGLLDGAIVWNRRLPLWCPSSTNPDIDRTLLLPGTRGSVKKVARGLSAGEDLQYRWKCQQRIRGCHVSYCKSTPNNAESNPIVLETMWRFCPMSVFVFDVPGCRPFTAPGRAQSFCRIQRSQ